MKKLFLNLLVLIILVPVNIVRSQDEYMLQIIKEQLSKSDLKKIEKAEKYLVSANEQMNEAKTYEGSAKSKNKILNKKISASTDLGSAHKLIYDVYLENVEKQAKIASSENAQKANKSIEVDYKLIKDAKKKREASLRINVLENAYDQLEQACDLEKKAIVDLAETYFMLTGKKTKVNPENNAKDENNELAKNSKKTSIEEKNKKTEQVKTGDLRTDNFENTKKNVVVEPIINEENKQDELNNAITEQDKKGAFFKIQIAASKSPLSVDQLNAIYKTNEMFNVEKDGEWYKYSVSRKFTNYDEALAYKDKLKIKGSFVIAYKNGKRVTIEEALKKEEVKNEIIENKSIITDNKVNIQTGKSIYRLQIGISTLRMTEKEISEFKNAGKPVLAIDHGGWFSYNIGEFNSQQEAQKFKNTKGLVDATVVKFVDGQLIE